MFAGLLAGGAAHRRGAAVTAPKRVDIEAAAPAEQGLYPQGAGLAALTDVAEHSLHTLLVEALVRPEREQVGEQGLLANALTAITHHNTGPVGLAGNRAQ